MVADLVVGVVVDVLVHVLVQHRNGVVVGRVPGSAGDFAVLDAGELVVLLPQIGFNDLGSRQEAENVRVLAREAVMAVMMCRGRRRLGQQAPSADLFASQRVRQSERRVIGWSGCCSMISSFWSFAEKGLTGRTCRRFLQAQVLSHPDYERASP